MAIGNIASIGYVFFIQVEIFLVLSIISEFHLTCGHQEHYVMRFWIVIASFPLTFYDVTLAGERFVLPCYCHAWIEVHVLHSASIDI